MAKYTVTDLAEKTGLEPHIVRAKLRQLKIEKNEEGVYGWDNDKDLKAVIAKVTGKAEKAEKEADAKKKAPKDKAEKKAPENKADEGKKGKKERVKPNTNR